MRTFKPPVTKRPCPRCMKITHFKYRKSIGHSLCKKCGWYMKHLNEYTDNQRKDIFNKIRRIEKNEIKKKGYCKHYKSPKE